MRETAPALIARFEARHGAALDAFLAGPPPSSARWWIGKPEVSARACARHFAAVDDGQWGSGMQLRFLVGGLPSYAKPEDPRPYFSVECADDFEEETSPWIVEHLTPFLEAAIREAVKTLPVEQAWREVTAALRGECDCANDPQECLEIAIELVGRLTFQGEAPDEMETLIVLRSYRTRTAELADYESGYWTKDDDLLPEPARTIYGHVRREIIGE